MKKYLPIIILFLAGLPSLQAQTLYGVTHEGGAEGSGAINKFMPLINSLTVARSFESFTISPDQTFVPGNDGKIYGITRPGGYGGKGGIFSLDPASSTFTKLNIIDATTHGLFPRGTLVRGSDGKFYGMTAEFGIAGINPGIFSFDLSTSTATTLKDFDMADGDPQEGSLVLAGNGKLYGMTASGGSSKFGIIFSFDLSTSTYTKLKDLEGPHNNGLVQASDGKLYGVTWGGAGNGFGGIFSVDTSTNLYTTVFDFDAASSGACLARLLQANNGKLYGIKYIGGTNDLGFIFSFDPSNSSFTNLQNLNLPDGAHARGDLTQAGDGKIYGMTFTGGLGGPDYAGGVIFSFDLSNNTYAKLRDFFHGSGDGPSGGLVQAANGKFYGATPVGGPDFDYASNGTGFYTGRGVIFSFDPVSFTYTKIKDNDVAESGETPAGSLILASNGKLYGVARDGGKGYGVIFSLDTSSHTYTKLKDFENSDGAKPCSIMQAANGKLYGMATHGGNNGNGVIFSFDPLTATYAKLIDFGNGGDGITPEGNLIQAADGKLYGMTPTGGQFGYGVIFSFNPLTTIYTKLRDFDQTNGGSPFGSLMQASDGKLYGVTFNGGTSNQGVIFSFNPSNSAYVNLKNFSFIDGYNPAGNLIQATNGKLYGLTTAGGSSGNSGLGFGTLFVFDPLTLLYTKLMDFDNINGYGSYGSLMQASDGKLYGTTYLGGNNNVGVIFSFDPVSLTYSKLKDYDGANGASPFGSSFVELPECTTNLAYYKDADGDGYGDPYSMTIALRQPAGYVANNLDCDDKSKSVHPVTYYRDADEDNLGDANISVIVCNGIPPAGFVKNKNDNDDHRKLQYALSNYPNPFKGTSTIRYELPFDSKVSIKVYDLLGRVVATLVDEDKKTGVYAVDFKAGKSGKGFLYCKIIAKSKDRQFEQTNKMVQLR